MRHPCHKIRLSAVAGVGSSKMIAEFLGLPLSQYLPGPDRFVLIPPMLQMNLFLQCHPGLNTRPSTAFFSPPRLVLLQRLSSPGSRSTRRSGLSTADIAYPI